jgi:hypothetical protein
VNGLLKRFQHIASGEAKAVILALPWGKRSAFRVPNLHLVERLDDVVALKFQLAEVVGVEFADLESGSRLKPLTSPGVRINRQRR